MPGRDVSSGVSTGEPPDVRRSLAIAGAAVTLLALGIAIGNRIASHGAASAPAVATMSTPSTVDRPERHEAPGTPARRTPAGAVAAAAQTITAFDGNVLLEPRRLRAVVERIASSGSRAQLVAAFQQASEQTRAKLGAGTVPRPVIVIRSVPVGYRIERFSRSTATIAVWYLGIVGSGATIEPQQSWRTQVVSFVWERGAWKVTSFESSLGPTPPLSTAEITETPGELFAAIPRFEEFQQRVEP